MSTQMKKPSAKTLRNRRRRQRQGKGEMSLVSAPVSKGFRSVNSGARISGGGDVVRIVHREYVADVAPTGTGFQTFVYKINPGLSGSFPWLSNLAANFEKYRFRSLRFMFQSSVATTSSGSVMMAIDLDTLDPAPATKAAMLQMQKVVRANVWDQAVSAIPEGVPELFVRTGNVPSGADAKTYDAGQLIIGVVGATAGVIGEAWFEYDVELHTPQTNQASPFSLVANTDDGSWDDGSFVGELGFTVTAPNIFVVQGFPGITYQFTLSSDDSADTLAISGGTELFAASVTDGGQRLVTRVRAGAVSYSVTCNPSVTPVRKILVTPVQSFQ